MEAIMVLRTPPVLRDLRHLASPQLQLNRLQSSFATESKLSPTALLRFHSLAFHRSAHLGDAFALSKSRSSQHVALQRMMGKNRNGGMRAALADVDVITEAKASGLQSALPQGEIWSIHKFGGTCVGSTERIWNVAGIIVDDASLRKVVVVSAMSKVTDMMYDVLDKAQSRNDSYVDSLEMIREKHVETATNLLGSGEELDNFLERLEEDVLNLNAMLRAIYIAGHATENFSDFVAGHGELWSAQMLSATVRKRGLSCVWMDAREVLVVNPTSSNQVDPNFEISLERLKTCEGCCCSEYSFISGGVGDGILIVQPCQRSYFGANVLHPRTTIPVMKYDIPIVIRNVFDLSEPGTKIWHSSAPTDDPSESDCVKIVKGFATIDNMALINVEGTGMAGVPGTASTIFETVKDVGANVVMISQASSEHSVCFAVPGKEVQKVAKALEEKFRIALSAGRLSKVEVIPNCAILAAVGQRMASTPGVSATLFNALAKANINVRGIAQGCSEYNITVVVNQEDSIRALKAVHSRFYLSKTPLAVGVVGPGLIGATFLEQLREQAAILKEEFNIDLRVMGIMGSTSMILDESQLDLSRWKELYMEKGQPANMEKFTSHFHNNHFVPNKVIVDCTADAEVARNYLHWLAKGIHVITPNKKANSGPLDQYLAVKKVQRLSYTHYFYEATVGAGLPIMSTLRGLLETGDKIERVEGIFSGTLSYIFNNFTGDKTFSQIVLEAKEAGFTEPDPRDDLSGVDVARKVIIVAREAGLKLELQDIPVESLVPHALQGDMSVEEYLKKLPLYDGEMSSRRVEAEQDGEVLRYVGVVDVLKNEGRVELRRYKTTDAFAQLSGSDNIIAFKSKRYQRQPLIVRGPGAGAAVTAGGVFSDVLRLASYLGAPS